MIHLLLDILQAPDPDTLEKFLGRIPMVLSIVIMSPHGYFGQANVLGLPDTGGQVWTFRYVIIFSNYSAIAALLWWTPKIQGLKSGNIKSVQIVYILDQVRALEKEMIENINNQGLQIIPQIIVVGSHHYTCRPQSIYGLGMCMHITSKRSWDWGYGWVHSCTDCFGFVTLFRSLSQLTDLYLSNGKVTRLIPDSKGTTCSQRIEKIGGTLHSKILRVPFKTEKGILQQWISRFDVWPYLEVFAEVGSHDSHIITWTFVGILLMLPCCSKW